eukprot:865687-Amorphochlora_amoeboformis.AAC.1
MTNPNHDLTSESWAWRSCGPTGPQGCLPGRIRLDRRIRIQPRMRWMRPKQSKPSWTVEFGVGVSTGGFVMGWVFTSMNGTKNGFEVVLESKTS